MRCCNTCLRCRHRVNGTHSCNMSQDKIPEEILNTHFCKDWIGAGGKPSDIKYKDYEDESQIERTRTCTDCKHCTEAYDINKEINRPYCPRKECFIADPSLAGSLCGWYCEKKKQ